MSEVSVTDVAGEGVTPQFRLRDDLPGLTVIDPLIAVAIGIAVLGEASNAPLWAIPVWALAGAIAVYGVFQPHAFASEQAGTSVDPRPRADVGVALTYTF